MICAILCGGAGSRLWPESRAMFPKPFFHLPNGSSLIQRSIMVASQVPDVKEIIIVSNITVRPNVIVEVQGVMASAPKRYIFEPVGRNTAAAVTTAALDVSRRYGGEEPMLILAADHLIADIPAFTDAVERANQLATEKGRLVTFGIKPTSPETGYGYIHHHGEDVIQFVEKPSLDVAKSYLEDGGYLWNSGMFCFKADTILNEIGRHSPEIGHATESCYEASIPNCVDSELRLDEKTFSKIPSNSIDYAVMEKSDNIAVVACDIGWNDIGSWRSLCELYPAGPNGNRVIGECDAFYIDSKNCTIHTSDDPRKVIAVIGMKDTLVADTGDALLVTTFNKSQEVRQVYDSLKKRKHETSVIHKLVKPPWGGIRRLTYRQGLQGQTPPHHAG